MPTTRAKAAKPAKDAPSARTKKLYRKGDAAEDKENNGAAALKKGTAAPSTDRRKLQQKAVANGLKANGKSDELQNALKQLDDAASRGFDAFVDPIQIKNKWESADDPKLAEKEELADLAFLGIKGKTPGGSKWRTRVTAKTSVAPMGTLSEEIHI